MSNSTLIIVIVGLVVLFGDRGGLYWLLRSRRVLRQLDVPTMKPQPGLSGGSPPAMDRRPAPSRLLLLPALAAGLVWVAACATAPPQTAADPGLPSPVAGLSAAREDAKEVPQQRANWFLHLRVAEQLRVLEAANWSATLSGARVLVVLGSSDGAEAALSASSFDSDALLLTGRIAEGRHDWQTAMDIYESLPGDNLERTSSLLRAKLQWRRSNLPQCAQQAIASPRLTRSELAILLVSLAPQLEPAAGGSSPVLPDIVDLPCSRGVLTVVRLGLLDIDRVEQRFFPSRAARPEEVRRAVEGLCHVLDLKPPAWCGQAEAAASCTRVSEPLRGEQVAEMVSGLVEAKRR